MTQKTVTLPNGTVLLANDKGTAKAYMSATQALKAAEKAGGQHIKIGTCWRVMVKSSLDS